MTDDGSLWVFGYGSLLWKTGFDYVERRVARLADHHRAFCLRSIRYRGTPEAPGLVLGLAPRAGAACEGVAFRAPPERAEEVRAYLHHREMGTDSYIESFLPLEVEGAGRVTALAYVMDVEHEQYAELSLEEQARVIASSQGPAGPNSEYLHNTVAHLRELGLHDPELETLDSLVRARQGLGAKRTTRGETPE